jgi:hypothetical protein
MKFMPSWLHLLPGLFCAAWTHFTINQRLPMSDRATALWPLSLRPLTFPAIHDASPAEKPQGSFARSISRGQ